MPLCTNSGVTRTHAARWSGAVVWRGWSSEPQEGRATGQRRWNAQPGGRAVGSGGSPGRPRGAKRDAGSPTRGNAADSAWAYGWRAASYTRAAGPSSTTRPAYITASRSHVPASTARSWLIMMSPTPCSATSRSISRRICACTITSNAVVGSSATISRGSQASAMAIMTRCRCPPDSSCGYAAARAAGRPTCSSSSPAFFRAPAGVAFRCSSTGSAIWSPTRRTGLRECIAPWNTIDAPAQRTARTRPHFMVSTSSPSSRTRPPTRVPAGNSRSRASASVDLPQPDSPASPSFRPASSRRSTPRTASAPPGYVTVSPLTSSRLNASPPAGG